MSGGAREGEGRKPAAEHLKKVPYNTKLPQLLDYFSDELGRPETAIDAAKSFIRYSAK